MSSYKQDLLDDLKSKPGYAAEYLTAAAADSTEAFLVALRDVGSARKGMTSLAAAADVNRVNLYQMLSEKGNPGIRNIRAIFGALKIRVRFEEEDCRVYPTPSPREHAEVMPTEGALDINLANPYGLTTQGIVDRFAYFYDTQSAAPGNSNMGYGFDSHIDQVQGGTAPYHAGVSANQTPLSPYQQLR